MSESSTSPGKSQKSLPSPFLTRRTRTYSATRTANDGPLLLVSFAFCICRNKLRLYTGTR